MMTRQGVNTSSSLGIRRLKPRTHPTIPPAQRGASSTTRKKMTRLKLILLDAFKDRMAFPELKVVALKQYKEWEPDAFIVEKKASGGPLIQELRALGIPVQEVQPIKGQRQDGACQRCCGFVQFR
jgi:hypothetical protein